MVTTMATLVRHPIGKTAPMDRLKAHYDKSRHALLLLPGTSFDISRH
jgi:hypothetical protein